MDTRVLLLAALCLLGAAGVAPVAAADVTVPIVLCDLEGHCMCREQTFRVPVVEFGRRCNFA